jgi:hypothetical protein
MLSKDIKNVNEFLHGIEELYPLSSHANYGDAWEKDIAFFAADGSVLEEVDERVLKMGLAIRMALHAAASGGQGAASASASPSASASQGDTESWKWLLTAPQVEQRTAEWYSETRNMLTASEIATVFKAGRTRGSLVMSKVEPVAAPAPAPTAAAADASASATPRPPPRLAVGRKETTSLDWGVRYEPVVKAHLEKTLGCTIQDLGRIRHRTDARIAASPDGLITSCSSDPALIGRLVEIKCPSTRVIKDDAISFEYWCQMQLQMEVCDRPACEFVEVKFREPASAAGTQVEQTTATPSNTIIDSGWITLESNIETDINRYLYHDTEQQPPQDETWASVETYQWELIKLRRVTVLRDSAWYANSQEKFAEFWKDVEAARAGTWQMPPARERKTKAEPIEKCGIVNETEPEA